jgi:hypothetical protein
VDETLNITICAWAAARTDLNACIIA